MKTRTESAAFVALHIAGIDPRVHDPIDAPRGWQAKVTAPGPGPERVLRVWRGADQHAELTRLDPAPLRPATHPAGIPFVADTVSWAGRSAGRPAATWIGVADADEVAAYVVSVMVSEGWNLENALLLGLRRPRATTLVGDGVRRTVTASGGQVTLLEYEQ